MKKDSTSRRAAERLGAPVVRKGKKVRFADGHWYRLRRGKLVQIPDEWVEKPHKLCGSFSWFYRRCKPRQSKLGRKAQRRQWDLCVVGRVPREKYERAKRKGSPRFSNNSLGHPRNRSPRHLRRKGRRQFREED